jgi:hypothetical protein
LFPELPTPIFSGRHGVKGYACRIPTQAGIGLGKNATIGFVMPDLIRNPFWVVSILHCWMPDQVRHDEQKRNAVSLCHEAGLSLRRTKLTGRLSEPRDKRGEFRRVRPVRRWDGAPEGLVTRASSFGSVFLREQENERRFME